MIPPDNDSDTSGIAEATDRLNRPPNPIALQAFAVTVTEYNEANLRTAKLVLLLIAGIFLAPAFGWIIRKLSGFDLFATIAYGGIVAFGGIIVAIVATQLAANFPITLKCPVCNESTVSRTGRFCQSCGAEAATRRFLFFRVCSACKRSLMITKGGGPCYDLCFCGHCGVKLHQTGYAPTICGLTPIPCSSGKDAEIL